MNLWQAFFNELPRTQLFFDYGVRTDGQPDYMGRSPIDTAENGTWTISFFKYDVSNNMIEKYTKEGAWADRVSLFAEYAV